MLLSELFQTLVARNGQYIISSDLSAFNLNMTTFWAMCQPTITRYYKFCPIIKTFNINVSGVTNYYDFTQDPNNVGFIANANSYNIAVSGTPTPGDIINLTITNSALSGGHQVISYTVLMSDTVITIAAALNSLINANTQCIINNITSTVAVNVLTVISASIIAYTTYSYTVSGAESEVLTIGLTPATYGAPPKRVTDCIPVNSMTLISTLAVFMSPLKADVWNPSRLIEPRPFIPVYRRPILYVTEQSAMDVTAIYDPQIVVTTNSNKVITEVEVIGIEDEPYFYILLQMLSGRFLKAVGLSRRAFTLTDMPVITDAAMLVQEGQTEYDEGYKALLASHPWDMSIRP
jgi:hypothetical protein